MGFRSIEIDIIQAKGGTRLFITHKTTLTSRFDLKEAFEAIRDFAFKTNNKSPAIISMESHIKTLKAFNYFMKALNETFIDAKAILFYKELVEYFDGDLETQMSPRLIFKTNWIDINIEKLINEAEADTWWADKKKLEKTYVPLKKFSFYKLVTFPKFSTLKNKKVEQD